jgi:hypothetical protein
VTLLLNRAYHALSSVKFYDDSDDRWFLTPYQQRKYSTALIRDHMDPFFDECRAYGRLIEKNVNGNVAVRCYGYLMLPADKEDELRERFGVTSWDRPDEEYSELVSKRESLRTIVKDLVAEDVPLTARTAEKMLLDLEKMLELGIYNMDIKARNYKGGHLIDFSDAITTPHYWVDTMSPWRYERKDLLNFDDMLDEAGVVTLNKAMPNQGPRDKNGRVKELTLKKAMPDQEPARKLRPRDKTGRVKKQN